MPLIDNKSQTMQEALKNALTNADRVDVSVGYFYFSGFEALAEDLKDKQVRILVGMEVDPACIPDIVQFSREADEDLSRATNRNADAVITWIAAELYGCSRRIPE